MKRSVRTNVVLPILLLFVSACYYDNEEILYPTTLCTSVTNPAFSDDILPLMNARCNNCHAGTSPSAGIRLDSYNEIVRYVNNGSLMGSINHTSGYSAMPKNGSKLSVCEIQKIQAWISSGLNK